MAVDEEPGQREKRKAKAEATQRRQITNDCTGEASFPARTQGTCSGGTPPPFPASEHVTHAQANQGFRFSRPQ